MTSSTRPAPHLSKSRYLAGLQCARRLWLGWHEPEPGVEAPAGTILAVGHEVGDMARQLFPGGILVGGGPRDFQEAVAQTKELILDRSVPAIFEAAFEFEDVWVRADVLQRREDGSWNLLEVKSSTGLKPEHIDDLAVQRYVLEGSGLQVASASLVHINTKYVLRRRGLDLPRFFACVDVSDAVASALADVPGRVAEMQQTLSLTGPPAREPSNHCFRPFVCEFWDRCTKDKPNDWIWRLPGLRAERLAQLHEMGVGSLLAVPDDFPLTAAQRRVIEAFREGGLVVQPGLSAMLPSPPPPVSYLDFETFSPAIPLYEGTRPYQRLAAQWSLHTTDASGQLMHREFLADLRADPRRAFAESLLEAVPGDGPIVVYSSFESSVLGELSKRFDDLAAALKSVQARLFDLLPVVRRSVDHPDFQGSNSIKAVAPVLAPELSYDGLADIAEGGAASAALYRLATGQFQRGESPQTLRSSLLRYCATDTVALALVHRALADLAVEAPQPAPT